MERGNLNQLCIAQVIGYLTSARIETGLLINFGSAKLQVKKYLQSLSD